LENLRLPGRAPTWACPGILGSKLLPPVHYTITLQPNQALKEGIQALQGRFIATLRSEGDKVNELQAQVRFILIK